MNSNEHCSKEATMSLTGINWIGHALPSEARDLGEIRYRRDM